MGTKSKILSLITAFVAAASAFAGVAACATDNTDNADDTVPPSVQLPEEGGSEEAVKLALSHASLSLPKGGRFTLSANKNAEWSTDEGSAVGVSGGLVSALSEGRATVTATCGGESATCDVKVGGAMLAIGDSIFTSEFSPMMLDKIAQDLGYTLYRDTISGSTVAPASGVGIVDHIDGGLYDGLLGEVKPDLILINRGTNDVYWSGIAGNPLKLGVESTSDKTKTYGAIKYTIDYFKEKYPAARIVWTNSIYRTDAETSRIDEFNRVLKSICSERNVDVINLRQAFPANQSSATTLLADGIHPNALGQSLYIEIIEKSLCFDFSSPIAENNLKWSKSVKTALAGSEYELKLATDCTLPVTYYCTDTEVAEYADGKVTVKKAGTSMIVAVQGNNIAVSVVKCVN